MASEHWDLNSVEFRIHGHVKKPKALISSFDSHQLSLHLKEDDVSDPEAT